MLTMTDTETHATYMRLPCLHKSFQQVFLRSGSFYTALAPCSHACTTDLGLHRTSCRQPISSILSLYQPTSSTHFINTIIVSTISSILSLYQVRGPTSHLINTIIAKEDETRARSEKSLLGPLCCVAKQVLDKAETCIHSSTDMRCSLQCDHLESSHSTRHKVPSATG